MKSITILVIALFLNLNLAHSENLEPLPFDQDHLTSKLESFKSLVEMNLVWRTKTASLITEIKKRIEQEKPLTAKQIRILTQKTIPEYSQIQNQLKNLISQSVWMAADDTVIEFSDQPTFFEKKCKPTTSFCRIFNRESLYAHLNPYDEKGTFYFLHGLNALAAASLLTDNYLLAFSQLQSNPKVREIMRYEIPGFEDFLSTLNDDFSTLDNYAHFSNSSEIFEKFKAFYKLEVRERLFETDEFAYLFTILKNNYALQEMSKDGSYDRYLKLSGEARDQYLADRLRRFRDERAYEVSRAFGNTAGSMRSRNGKLKNMPEAELQGIQNKLRPLDILFEKTPFILTDKLIPGHFGHVGIWIGTKEDLIDLGIWEHPIVIPHQESIESGKGIVEALRPGVQINDLRHFMDIDDLAIVRTQIELNKDEKAAAILRTIKQIGKDYDFNFDVETRTRIVCSELIYIAFEDVDWETERTLGRHTISPEHVGKKVNDNGMLETLILYHDGAQYRSNLNNRFQVLLKEEYDKFPYQHYFKM